MATSSIFDNIVINNKGFIEQYEKNLNTPHTQKSHRKQSGTSILLANTDDNKRMAELRLKRRLKNL